MTVRGLDLTILIVNDFAYVYGGASHVALSSARELARRGHSIVLFTAIPPIDPSLQECGVRVVCLDQKVVGDSKNKLGSAIQAVWNRHAAAEMEKVLQSLDASTTIVHLHTWTRGLSPSIVPVIERHGACMVATLHDYFLACPNGGFYNYASESICHLKPLSLECLLTSCGPGAYPTKMWRSFRQFVQLKAGHLPSSVHNFISVSPLSRAVLEPFLPPASNIYNISNPIDISQSPPVNVAKNDYFVMVGRLSASKSPLLLAAAASQCQVKVRFIGDGELRQQLESEYPAAEVTGWLPQSEVQKYLEGARALVFPSRWYETQGLAILEAAARGIPAVVADSCAGRDFISNGSTGLLFRGADVSDLAKQMSILKDDAVVSRLGQAAYEHHWKNPPTLESHVDRLEACYARMIDG